MSKSLYQVAIDKMRNNRLRKLSGKHNCIPHDMPRFSEYWPGIERGKYIMVTANSGVGKSKFCKKLVFDAIDFTIHNQDMLNAKVFYFCLEESKVNFMQTLMSYRLWRDYSIRKSTVELNSIKESVDESVLKMLENSEYWELFEQMIEVIDNIRTPTGIFEHVRTWLELNGKWENGRYIPNNEERYVIIVVDHFSLLYTESGADTLHKAMTKLSSDYFLQLRDKYDCTVINVQQQMSGQEEKQFNYKGTSIESKVQPTLAGLGDNKLTQRDVDIAFGLFAPERYEIEEHRGYNVLKLEDHYRSVMILKFRDGISNIKLGCFFDGACGVFEELPLARRMRDEDYHELMIRVKLIKNTNQTKLEFKQDEAVQ